jgi:hypothetical protein
MGKKRTEIGPFDGLPQLMGTSDGFLATEANFFATLTI